MCKYYICVFLSAFSQQTMVELQKEHGEKKTSNSMHISKLPHAMCQQTKHYALNAYRYFLYNTIFVSLPTVSTHAQMENFAGNNKKNKQTDLVLSAEENSPARSLTPPPLPPRPFTTRHCFPSEGEGGRDGAHNICLAAAGLCV